MRPATWSVRVATLLVLLLGAGAPHAAPGDAPWPPLPTFEAMRSQLPSPIYDEAPEYVQLYWKSWELAFGNLHLPAPHSGFVAPFIDASFNEDIFLWDTCFMSMFTNYAHPLVPGIASLDNFYAKQHPDGEISREINRTDGRDVEAWVNAEGRDLFSRHGTDWNARGFAVTYVGRETPQPPPALTLDALSHPIAAWAELESYRVSGDRVRLARVYAPLSRYFRALQKYLRQGNGLYLSDWSSMDNSPRNTDLVGGGTAIDTSAEMVLFAEHLARIADLLRHHGEARGYRRDARTLALAINAQMWDPQARFYFDLRVGGERSRIRTIAAFWTLLAGVASRDQAAALVAALRDPARFGRLHPVPTLSADEQGYNPDGGYWRGAAWAPTTTMVIRGLERYGEHRLARDIALQDLRMDAAVYAATGTIWENYAPDAAAPGKPAKADFVGWSGLGPIVYLIEFAIGLRADAPTQRIDWNLETDQRAGVERFRLGGGTLDLVTDAAAADGHRTLRVRSDRRVTLVVHWRGRTTRLAVGAGERRVVRL